jgi:Ser/Thr protein kinase RdoA (MazF antagonist)
MRWLQRFDVPIVFADGSALATLHEAGRYVMNLPAAKQKEPHWQIAAGALVMAAERGGIVILAEIAMRQALAHDEPQPPRTPRKKAAKKYRIIR